MAEIGLTVPNMLEQARMTHNDEVLWIAEVLAEKNEWLMDAPVMEANDKYQHVAAKRLYLPSVSKRRINKGTANSKAGTDKFVEGIENLVTRSQIDKLLLDRSSNKEKERQNYLKPHIEALIQEFSYDMLHGNNSLYPDEIDGIFTRSPWTSLDDSYTFGMGGTGSDLTSVLVIEWGEDTVHLVYPQGDPNIGVNHDDRGLQECEDSDGNFFPGYVDYFNLNFGLVVKDNRAIQRLANIESAGTSNNIAAGVNNLLYALANLPSMGNGNVVIYANRKTKAQFDIQANNKSNAYYTIENVNGKRVTMFQGIPIRIIEQIPNTQSALS